MDTDKNTIPRPEECAVCPPHPGTLLKRQYLDAMGITIGSFADRIGVSRKAMSMICNGRKRITPEMALRLGKATGSRPGFWLDLQAAYDMWQVLHLKPGFLDRISRIAAAL